MAALKAWSKPSRPDLSSLEAHCKDQTPQRLVPAMSGLWDCEGVSCTQSVETRSWGRHLRQALIAGISLLALGACTSTDMSADTSPQTLAPTSETFSLLTDAELTADMPHLAAGGDAKTYAASFIHWTLSPGHMIERSHMLATGAPPDLADPAEFSNLVRDLADEGNAEAILFKVIGSSNDVSVLSASQNPAAYFFLQTRRLHQGSLAEKIEALAWMRKEAATNKDAAFALGGFLIDQGASQDYQGPTPRLLATPPEIAEGTRLLKGVAAHTTLESMIHIADLLENTLDTPAADPVALRRMLEIAVAATSVTPVEGSTVSSGISQELGGDPGIDATYQAVSLRIGLAELLETGRGGPADVERAKGLYLEAVKTTQDSGALKALKRLGVDVSAYETPDDAVDAKHVDRNDAWEDQ